MKKQTPNSAATAQKHEDFQKLLSMELNRIKDFWKYGNGVVTNGIFGRRFIIVDTHCGEGTYDGIDGSPIIAIQTVKEFRKTRKTPMEIEMIFNDAAPEKIEKLEKLFFSEHSATTPADVEFWNIDAAEMLDHVFRRAAADRSLIFFVFIDPFSVCDLPIHKIAQIRQVQKVRNVHMFVNLNKTAFARTARHPKIKNRWYGDLTFNDVIDLLNPGPNDWIRRFRAVPSDKWQFCLIALFAHGTSPKGTAMKLFELINSDAGRREIDLYNDVFVNGRNPENRDPGSSGDDQLTLF